MPTSPNRRRLLSFPAQACQALRRRRGGTLTPLRMVGGKLSSKTTPPPGLDADTIDRESVRADQSELILADARTCIRRNVGVVGSLEASDAKQSTACFADFSKRMSARELGALAKPSFEMLVRQERSASK